MNILFLASEVAGVIKSGGLADVAKALPLQLQADGHKVVLVMPCYSIISNVQNFPVVANAVLNENNMNPDLRIPFSIRKTNLASSGVELLLIDCPRFFDRTSLYGDNNQA